MIDGNTNLLKETVDEITRNGKRVEDVIFVTDGHVSCDWTFFADCAKSCDYYAGYGGAEIDGGLKVVGEDWWLERHEYDGSEWWEFKTLPKITPSGAINLKETRYGF